MSLLGAGGRPLFIVGKYLSVLTETAGLFTPQSARFHGQEKTDAATEARVVYDDDDDDGDDDDECGDGDSDGDGDGGLLVRPASQCDLYVRIILFSPPFFRGRPLHLQSLKNMINFYWHNIKTGKF